MPDLVIPAPAAWISSNGREHRMQTAALSKRWRTAAYLAARNAHLGEVPTPCHVFAHIWKPRANRYDPGNLYPTAKAVLDGLTDAGVWPDDDHTHVIGPDMRHGGKGEARLVLTITPVG